MIHKFFRRFSVGQLVLLLLVAMVAITAMNVGLVYHSQSEVAGIDKSIDVAGEQRLTTLQIALYTDRIAQGDDAYDELATAIEKQDRDLQALQHGGTAAGYQLDPPPAEVRDQLETHEREWAEFRAHAITVLEEPRDSEEFAESALYIQENHDAFVETADTTVEAFAAASESRNQFVQELLIGLFGVNLLILVSGAYLIRRDVVGTLLDVDDAINTMANGSLDPTLSARTRRMSEAYEETEHNELMSLASATERLEAYHKTVLRQSQALARQDFDADVLDEDVPGEFGDALATVHQNLQELIETYKSAIEHAGISIMITDEDGEIEYVNTAYEAVTGYDPEQAIGRKPGILQSCDHDVDTETVWRTIGDGDVWHGEYTNERKTGDRYTLKQTIAPILQDAGEPKKFVITQQDVTEQKQREQQLMVLLRILRHNLRNNLNVVMGYAELLEEELAPMKEFGTLDTEHDPSEVIRYVRDECELPTSLAAELAEIERVVDQISTMSTETIWEGTQKIQDNSAELLTVSEKATVIGRCQTNERTNDAVAVSSVLEELVAEYREEFPSASIEIAGETAAIRGDREDFRNVIAELLENALDHSTRTSPQVTIRVRSEAAGKVAIEVRDTGPGLPEMEREVIERGEEEPLVHGSGIGLWFATWLVNKQGGTITFAENEPRGTVVTVEFPKMQTATV